MILYLDTSAFLKLFLLEAFSDFVLERTREAESLATSRVAFVESCAGMARRFRQGRLAEAEHAAARQALEERWPHIGVIDLDEFAAGQLAFRHGLRAFDAVHLAAAMKVRTEADGPDSVLFCTFDASQAAAARAEKFQVVPPR